MLRPLQCSAVLQHTSLQNVPQIFAVDLNVSTANQPVTKDVLRHIQVVILPRAATSAVLFVVATQDECRPSSVRLPVDGGQVK